jgi:cell division topological specificity factor
VGGNCACHCYRFFKGEKKKTANVAKERLQIILAHERGGRTSVPDFLPALQRDLIAVISKYIKIDPSDIKVNLERDANMEILEVKIELPDGH